MKSGGTPKKSSPIFYGGNIPWVTISDFKNSVNDVIYETDQNLTEEGLKEINNRIFPKGTLLLAMYGSVGKTAILGVDASTNQAILGIQPKNYEVLNINYLKFWLDHNQEYLSFQSKGATLKNISLSIVEKMKIDLPEIETQNRIVALLDKAKSLLEKRDKILMLYNEFLKSIFLEMFGEKNPNFNYWQEVSIVELGKNKKSFRTGPFGSRLKHERFKEEGEIAVLGIDNAVENTFKWKKKRFISIEDFNEFKNFQVFPRDVIITIMGTVGKSAVIPENIGTTINTKHLAAITLNENRCNPYYLAFSIHSNPYITGQLRIRERGAVMNGLNLTLIKELKIKEAPIELQNRFELIYKQSIKAINNIINSKHELQKLFDVLSYLLFKGELDFNTAVDLEMLLENDYSFFKQNSNQETINLLLERLDKDELNNNRFYDQRLYDKAKEFVFELLKENRIKQVFDDNSKRVKLTI